jgi:maltokinase
MTNGIPGNAVLAGESLTGLLKAWLPSQRWFAGGGTITDINLVSDARLASGDPELRHLMIRVGIGETAVDYQVLVGLRPELPPELAPALIGRMSDGRFAYDALYDAELTRLLLRGIAQGQRSGSIRFMAEPGAVISDRLAGRPLSADQSNTNVVFGDQAILKVLRRPMAGRHPDLEIPAALTGRGSTIVPALLGWIENEDDGEPTALAILSRYLPGARTAWDLATANIAAGQADFTAQARALGRTTGEMHAELAQAFGTKALSPDALASLAAVMNADLDAAMITVPELRQYEADLRSCYRQLEQLGEAVPAQRIHGDYHLGQVLEADGRWVVLDFEGEPAIPLPRRQAFAPVLRDVAGMLRSFDYASRQPFMDGTVQRRADEAIRSQAQRWARDCQDAFCDGYASEYGMDPEESGYLLKAFLTQKAVYEAVYEARHRPGWLQIPISAIAEACA